jgi:hypothetical protein
MNSQDPTERLKDFANTGTNEQIGGTNTFDTFSPALAFLTMVMWPSPDRFSACGPQLCFGVLAGQENR